MAVCLFLTHSFACARGETNVQTTRKSVFWYKNALSQIAWESWLLRKSKYGLKLKQKIETIEHEQKVAKCESRFFCFNENCRVFDCKSYDYGNEYL